MSRRSAERGRFYVGVDIGGTFTDCAVVDEGGEITVGKVPSTPADFSEGFFAAIDDAARTLGVSGSDLLGRTRRLAHGTTVGINALVTRTGSKVGLLATAGHGDALKIMDNTGRVTGASVEQMLHYAASDQPQQLVDGACIQEIVERVDHAGDEIVPLDLEQAAEAIQALLEQDVEAVAISLLWSFANHHHEQQLAQLVTKLMPDAFVSVSHQVAPRIAEYPRTAATVFNAYIGPLMRRYIERIVAGASSLGYAHPVLFATCTGGLISADSASELPLLTVQSGPVAGVVATSLLGPGCGFPDVISTDMGGTTLDVSVVSGGRPMVRETAVIERHQLHLRMVDVESVGAGGGSIAWVDPENGTLRVGPHSAGSEPGPACYGRGGTEPTVTDADLVLGILSPDGLLGGRLKLDREAAERAVGKLAEQLGLGLLDCAGGIVEIVDARMEDLVRRMTIARGLDPRDFALYGYGGGAAAHASLYGRGLGVRRLVVPLADVASVWSALGVAVGDVVRTYERSVYMRAPFDQDEVAAIVDELEAEARHDIRSEGAHISRVDLRRSADMKYGLQVFEVESRVPDGDLRSDPAGERMIESFEEAYAARFGAGSGYRDAGVILTALRVEARGTVPRPSLEPKDVEPGPPPSDAAAGTRPIYWWELRRQVDTPIFTGPALRPGNTVEGPAVIEYPDTTAVVRPEQRAELDAWGNLIISLDGGADPGGGAS